MTGRDPALDRLVGELSARLPAPNRDRGRAAVRSGKRLQRTAGVKRVAGPATGLLAVAGVVVLLGTAFGVFGRPKPTASSVCGAGTAMRFHPLGAVAYVRDDSLRVVDLAGRQDRLVVAHDVVPPVRWSPDGQWIAFQRAIGTVGVIPAAGGPVCQPLGSDVRNWSWSPVRAVLAGVTGQGGLVFGGPTQRVRSLLPDGWGAGGAPVFRPDGRTVAVARTDTQGGPQGLWTVDVTTKEPAAVLPAAARDRAQAVAGWSPDGTWILFWTHPEGSASMAADGLPLEAVEASGGDPVPVVPDMLPFPDFVDWCEGQLVAVAGAGRDLMSEKHLVASGPPGWSAAALSDKPGSTDSVVWPSCSPHGQLVVASVGPSRENAGDPLGSRWALWLIQPNGFIGGPATDPGQEFSDEAPRWSRDGSSILFVRREIGTAHGVLYLLEPTSPARGPGTVTGPLADLGSHEGQSDYFPWSAAIDWYQPRR